MKLIFNTGVSSPIRLSKLCRDDVYLRVYRHIKPTPTPPQKWGPCCLCSMFWISSKFKHVLIFYLFICIYFLSLFWSSEKDTKIPLNNGYSWWGDGTDSLLDAGNVLYLDVGGGFVTYSHIKIHEAVHLRFGHFTDRIYLNFKKFK